MELQPQHFAAPPAATAHVWLLAAEIARAPLPSPDTGVGVDRFVVVPSPSWPAKLLPQHRTAPPDVRAHAWACPVATASTPLDSPLTGTGVSRVVVVPSPSWPELFWPQHMTPPPDVTAHVKPVPPAAAAAVCADA